MEPNVIQIEPERLNAVLKWWSAPEAQTLLDCLDKARHLALMEAANLQSQAVADRNNQNFETAAGEKLQDAADFRTAIEVLKHFFPDGPFISRIEV